MARFVTPTTALVTKQDRRKLNGHPAFILWFTGLSGSGKSTLAREVERVLLRRHVHAYVLDGDNIRTGLNRDLGFSAADRRENVRRIGEVAKLFVDAGVVAITAFISPYRTDRAFVRKLVAKGEFIEVHVKCPLRTCEARDIKGLYRKARAGVIPHFTGVADPYQPPRAPELSVATDRLDVPACVARIITHLERKQLIAPRGAQRTR